jgi:hypothetical protein
LLIGDHQFVQSHALTDFTSPFAPVPDRERRRCHVSDAERLLTVIEEKYRLWIQRKRGCDVLRDLTLERIAKKLE